MTIKRVVHLISFAGPLAFLVAVLALHRLRPDLNPAGHTISEYSIGSWGWLMRAAFGTLGLGVLGVAASIRFRFAASFSRRVGLLLLVTTAVGLFLDAAYNTDRPHVAETLDGMMHGLGTWMLALTLPVASFILASLFMRASVAISQSKWLQVLASAELLAVLGFESNALPYRGLAERLATVFALTSLLLLRSSAVALTEDARRLPARPWLSGDTADYLAFPGSSTPEYQVEQPAWHPGPTSADKAQTPQSMSGRIGVPRRRGPVGSESERSNHQRRNANGP